LVDPRHEADFLLRDKPRQCVFVNKALAATPRRLTICEQEGGKTTLLERTPLTAAPVTAQYDVDAITLDDLLESVLEAGTRSNARLLHREGSQSVGMTL
jgi:hypothetical protein